MVPAREIAFRLAELRKQMRGSHLGAYFVSRGEDVHYLSGFSGEDSALLITQKRCWLITDSRYTEEAGASAPAFETILWKKHPCRFAGELAKKSRASRLGFSAGDVSVTGHRELAGGGRGVRLVAAGELVGLLRARKSAWEIGQIEAALRCAEAAFRAARLRLRTGMTEKEFCLELDFEMRRRGADRPAFSTIVAAGPNASRPHAHPGSRRIRAGVPLLIDFGARVNRYNCDLTRVVFPDSIRPPWKCRYEMVLEAQRLGIAAIAPGRSGQEVDEAARGFFGKHGCADRFAHSLGHGVGLAVHEAPRLGRGVRGRLEEGAVVTVEPGLYFVGQGGIRIEDMVLVTGSGGRVLSRLEKGVDQAIA